MLLQALNLIGAIFIDDTERAEMLQQLHGAGANKMNSPTPQQHPTYLRLLDAVQEEARRVAGESFNGDHRCSTTTDRFTRRACLY
jgi:midasin